MAFQAGTFFVLLGAFHPCPVFSSPPDASTALVPVTGQTDCPQILQAVRTLAALLEMPLKGSEAPARAGSRAPDWLKPLQELNARFEPSLEFIRFADSQSLVQILAIQLRDLGIESAQEARDLVESLPDLPLERQLAFSNGLVFRAVLEATRFREREDFSTLFFHLGASDYARLALFLHCHFRFQAAALARRVFDGWDDSEQYPSAPVDRVDPELRPWIKLHGVFLDPSTGKRLYQAHDLVLMVTSLIPVGDEAPLIFFLESQLQHLTPHELQAIRDVPALPGSLAERIDGWNGRDKGSMFSKAQWNDQQRLRATTAALAAVQTRLNLLQWEEQVHAAGDANQLLESLRTGLNACMATAENQTCGWVFKSVTWLLDYIGISKGFGSYLLSGFLKVLVEYMASEASQGTAQAFLSQIQERTGPLLALAGEIRAGASTPQEREALMEQQRILKARLEELSPP